METQRLRALQHPSSATTLLESYVLSQDQIPTSAERVNSVSELTVPLRHVVQRTESHEAVWCAWTMGIRIWFFSAVPSLALSREHRKPVLHITAYDEHGAMLTVGPYAYTPTGWQRCA